MKPWLRALCLLAGIALLATFLARADWPAVREVLKRLGWLAPIPLLPYLAVYAVDTFAWSVTLPRSGRPSYGRLFRIRWAGEAVNNLVPTGYIGGEAVKVFLLRRQGVPTHAAAAAAVTSKTAQTVAQVAFILLGAVLFARLAPRDGTMHTAMVGIVIAGLLTVSGMVLLQRRGVAATVIGIVERLRLRLRWIDRRRDSLIDLDRQVREFYGRDRKRFLLSTVLFFGGWLLDGVEVFLLGHFMGIPVGWSQALAIEAFIGVAKILGLFIPGAVGVQESGVVLLCRLAGLPEPFGYAYALWRRMRELIYAGVGWLLLSGERANLREMRSVTDDDVPSPAGR